MSAKTFILTTMAFLSACGSAQKGPEIQFRTRIINLGQIPFRKGYAGKIWITNGGDKTLTILSATADCSCTVTKIEHENISPGDSTYLAFTITPAIDGYLQQSILVKSNSTNNELVLFLLRANVILNK